MAHDINRIKSTLENFRQEIPYPAWDNQNIQSAVLIPIIDDNCELSLIFTRRSENLEHHAGQVAFPGGMREPSDQTPVDTALRESQEEIGVNPANIEVFGKFPPYNLSTGFCVYPVVGYLRQKNGLIQNNEVEKYFCVSLSWLEDSDNAYLSDYRTSDGSIHRLWFFKEFSGETIWGLTAQITKDFLEIIKKGRSF